MFHYSPSEQQKGLLSGLEDRYRDSGTLMNPDVECQLQILSRVIVQKMKSADYGADPFDVDNFLEERYQVTIPVLPAIIPFTQFKQQRCISACPPPTHDTVYHYIEFLFRTMEMSSESTIISLVYLDRLHHDCHCPLTNRNWRTILLVTLLIASKVWDDVPLWNVEFTYILPVFSLRSINLLERLFLETVSYHIHISGSEYAEYYFMLRELRVRTEAITVPTSRRIYIESSPRMRSLHSLPSKDLYDVIASSL